MKVSVPASGSSEGTWPSRPVGKAHDAWCACLSDIVRLQVHEIVRKPIKGVAMTAHKARTCTGQGQPLRFGDHKGAGPETGSAKWAVTIEGGQVPSPPLVITVTIRAAPDPSEPAMMGQGICGDPNEDTTVHPGNRGSTLVYEVPKRKPSMNRHP